MATEKINKKLFPIQGNIFGSKLPYIIVAFYTVDTAYEDVAKTFRESLDVLDLPYFIQPIEPMGDWYLNTYQKPRIILEALNMFPNKDVLYNDVDAKFHRHPSLFDHFEGDIGAYYYEKYHCWAAGTIYFHNTQTVRKFVSDWYNACCAQVKHGKTGDQHVWNMMLKDFPDLRPVKIPESYLYSHNRKTARRIREPVIEHTIESKKSRSKVNGVIGSKCQIRGLGDKRDYERSKYEYLYTQYKKPYGEVMHGIAFVRSKIRERLNIQSVCDIGTGTGNFPREMVKLGYEKVYGVDFASSPKGEGVRWIKASAHNVPLADRCVEWVTSFDMLEHVLPEDVDLTLNEFNRLATKGFVLTINYSKTMSVMGSNLHQTVRHPVWWNHKLQSYGTAGRYSNFWIVYKRKSLQPDPTMRQILQGRKVMIIVEPNNPMPDYDVICSVNHVIPSVTDIAVSACNSSVLDFGKRVATAKTKFLYCAQRAYGWSGNVLTEQCEVNLFRMKQISESIMTGCIDEDVYAWTMAEIGGKWTISTLVIMVEAMLCEAKTVCISDNGSTMRDAMYLAAKLKMNYGVDSELKFA